MRTRPSPRSYLRERRAPAELDATPRISIVPTLAVILVLTACAPWLLNIRSPLVGVLTGCLVVQCAHGAARAVVGGHHLMRAIFWTFNLCYLAVPAAYQVSTNQAAWGDEFIYSDATRLTETLLVLNLAFAAFGLGGANRHRLRRRVSPTAGQRPPRGVAIPALYGTFALLLLPLVISRTGGITALVSSRSERVQRLAAAGIGQGQSGGVAVALVTILPGALALAATYLLLLLWRQRRRPATFLLVGCGALLILYTNPLANTRYVSAVALVAVLLVVLQPRTTKALAVVVAALIVGLLGIYPLANAFRSPEARVESVSLADNDFDGFQQVVNAHQYVEEQGHTLGVHVSSAALFFLPRSIWEEKARPASIPVAANRGYDFTNLSLPLPGELYLEFGVLVTGAVMFLWGRLWRRLDDEWADGTDTPWAALVPYLAIAQVGLLRGPLGSLMPVYATTLVLLFVAVRRPGRWWLAADGAVPSSRRGRDGSERRRRGSVT